MVAKKMAYALVAFASIASSEAIAQASNFSLNDKYVEYVDKAKNVAPLSVDNAFGDQISHYNGAVEFSATDISLPGNGALRVELKRSFAVDNRWGSNGTHLGGFGDWDIDIPHLSGVFSDAVGGWVNEAGGTQRCTVAGPPRSTLIEAFDYWQGYRLHVPGRGDQSLLTNPSAKLPAITDGNTYPWITKDFWRVTCKTATKNGYPGEAFIAVSPEGLRYHFDWAVTKAHAGFKQAYTNSTITRKVIYLLASRVEDRFGNWVEYTYSGDKLTAINANDGRQITLAYSGDKIISATSSAGTWGYGYNGAYLIRATQPDGASWTYAGTGTPQIAPIAPPPIEDDLFECPENLQVSAATYAYSVTHPAGAKADFSFVTRRHYRNNVQKMCQIRSPSDHYLQISNFFDSLTLISKVVTGLGIPTLTWTYAYGNGSPIAFMDKCAIPGSETVFCKPSKLNTVSRSDGHFERYEYGILNGVNEGQLLRKDTGSGPSAIVRTEIYTYMSAADAGTQPYPLRVGSSPLGWSDLLSIAELRPLKKTEVRQDGVGFSATVNSFDAFSNPTSVTKSSAPLP